MANELRIKYLTGKTLYAILIRVTDGQVYNGSGFEMPLAANWGTYAITLAPQSTTGLYYGDMPAVAADIYDVLFFWQSGGSPATTDALVGPGSLDWSSSGEATVASRSTHADIIDINNTLASLLTLLMQIGASRVTLRSPVDSAGKLTILEGDSYYAVDNRAIYWSDPTWPDLTDSTVTFNRGVFSKEMTIITATGEDKTIRLELSSQDTLGLETGTFGVVVTLPNGHSFHLLADPLQVRKVE
jgi:hypothetical protein